ncbi:polyprenyl synthetase family protein [Saccharothrix coeruleofusca]|uniref:Geranylgeranyl pyrophosphate synthase n=1 Tax=Saccharothrix coeruleofusca TaxID=33919 RepID=A0A918AKZ8_9PSEU|nr:polyprenyl synthetase family protein [Saccharothrix coeruleofusca]MBP2336221.1 geranylgeranyl diphosphate synthase type I [Saccharothrix coeruleofusca]GGP54531.1 geranylgeranyl pyrophosphate synthase [Saccharothrix coeruleofusca]
MSLATTVDSGHPSAPPADDALPARLGLALEDFLRERPHAELAPELAEEVRALVLGGGKRVRPTFAWWGWRAAGGAPRGQAAETALRALVALELLQACALVHDDVMDRSTTRRGRPAAHRAFATRHRRARWAGDSRHYGDCAAILVGDLALAWADDALVGAGLDPAALRRAWRPWQAMRTEMMAGQHLDLVATARREESLEETLRVARFKTAAYTVERPLHLGAALADAPAALVEALRAFGRDVGVAFQLRDDLLGVFGDVAVTGKPVGDDLREGKRTPLVATALGLARAAGRERDVRLLRDCLGGPIDEETVARVRALLVELGAVAAIEERIGALTARGLQALEGVAVEPVARERLVRLAAEATARKY